MRTQYPQDKNKQGKSSDSASSAKGMDDRDSDLYVASGVAEFYKIALIARGDDLRNEWIMDFGCSFHMYQFRYWFDTLTPCSGGSVVIANDTICKVVWLGTVKVKMFDGVVRTLGDTRYIPDLRKNLISVGTLNTVGFVYGKQKRVSFKARSHTSKGVLDYVHSDVWGPIRDISNVGAQYFVTFIDDYSRKWKARVKIQTRKKLKCFRSNNVTEYKDDQFMQYDMELKHMDVKTIFLYGYLEEIIYMDQPEGFVEPGKEGLICRLKRSLYGLKRSPRQWYKRFDGFMVTRGYSRSEYDPDVYYRFCGDGYVLLLKLYVDDILIAAKSKKGILQLKKMLSKETPCDQGSWYCKEDPWCGD
ncbi:Retrovirus-related Pol polyprotein from transposon TNT 1-94-like protein [Drosera capensis]